MANIKIKLIQHINNPIIVYKYINSTLTITELIINK